MAKILFIEKKPRYEKMGIMYLSAILKKNGHQTDMIQMELEDIDDKMASYKPDFVCYSICTGEHDFALETNNALKKKYRFKSVFGGSHCTFFPEIAKEENIDFLVLGQGETAVLDIVEGREKNKIVHKPLIDDVNDIPFPDREIFYKYDNFRENPMKNVMVSRDCPYSCSFCFNHLWREMYQGEIKKLFQKRTVDNVIEEIKQIKENYPLRIVHFLDDNFMPLGDWGDEFCEKYKKEINLPFCCSMTANLATEETVKKLKDAGLDMVKFALESADSSVRKNILNKPHIKDEDVRNAMGIFKKYGIKTRIFNMIGLPIEDPLADALNTLKFNQEVQPTESWVSIFQPYPKLKLTQYCLDKGFIDKNAIGKSSENYFSGTQLKIPDRDKIDRLQKWWHFIVVHNIPVPVADILISLPISNEQADKLQEIRFDYSKNKLYGI
jgi:radical SAM superfamily enzyme YgiQ (UPF0313 family)